MKTTVVHKTATFIMNAKKPEFSMLSLISRSRCDYIFAVYEYIFFKSEISTLAIDIMSTEHPGARPILSHNNTSISRHI